ncbi:chorismate mutase [endosymbiont of Sipalinus gigas]|nr:chorismate mutase [endosymbiont of Sipalinus gigas]
MKNSLDKIRKKIDIIDKEIFYLFSERFNLVKNISDIKSKLGLLSFDKDRESFILNKIINDNTNISKNFIEDILNRVFFESYILENNTYDKIIYNTNSKINITIIGGDGNMGILFKDKFIKSGYIVKSINSSNWDINLEFIINSNVIIISVPISKFISIIDKLNNLNLSKNIIIVDISSIKHFTIKSILNIHEGPVLGLHPMFSNNIDNFSNQIMICCNGRLSDSYKWILDQFKLWGLILHTIDSIEHDKYMLYIQYLRYFIFLSYGLFLIRNNININEMINISPSFNYIFLNLFIYFFNQDSKIYIEIINYSKKNDNNIINSFLDNINLIKLYIKNNKIDEIFNEIKKWINLNIDKKYINKSSNIIKNSIILK